MSVNLNALLEIAPLYAAGDDDAWHFIRSLQLNSGQLVFFAEAVENERKKLDAFQVQAP